MQRMFETYGARAGAGLTAIVAAILLAAALVQPAPATADEGSEGGPYAYVGVFQEFKSDWTGMTETYEYVLEAKTAGAPLPVVERETDRISEDGTCFYFTFDKNENDEENPRQLKIDLQGFDPQYSQYDYELYMVSKPEADYTYHRCYMHNAETGDYDFMGDERAMHDATVYEYRMYPRIVAGGEVAAIFETPDGMKVYDPGWTVAYVGNGPQKVVEPESEGIDPEPEPEPSSSSSASTPAPSSSSSMPAPSSSSATPEKSSSSSQAAAPTPSSSSSSTGKSTSTVKSTATAADSGAATSTPGTSKSSLPITGDQMMNLVMALAALAGIAFILLLVAKRRRKEEEEGAR